MSEHKLIDGALQKRQDGGIVARCECGWVSSHFSALAASAAFKDHQEREAEKRPDMNHVPTVIMQRIAEASQSWMLLRAIEQQFGDQDGCVGRDMRSAETRLRNAIAELPPPPEV